MRTTPTLHLPDRPPRVGVLTNPASRANQRQLGAVRQLLSRHPEVSHQEVTTPAAVTAAVVGFRAAGVELIVINAGDGTVGLVLAALLGDAAERALEPPPRRDRERHGDDLAEAPAPAPATNDPIAPLATPAAPAIGDTNATALPFLCLIKGGNTSMDAGDVGQPGSHLKALEQVLTWARAPTTPASLFEREVLKLTVADGTAPLYGMFFGAGAIIDGIEYCDQAVHSRGIGSAIGPGLCTLRVILALFRGDRSLTSPTPMVVKSEPPLAHQTDASEDTLVLLVSTLERLFLGLRPYWSQGNGETDGPLQLSTVRFQPSRILRTLPPLLWGHAGRHATAENGYRSGRVRELALQLDGLVTLDGELYQASREAGPVRITGGGRVRFLVA